MNISNNEFGSGRNYNIDLIKNISCIAVIALHTIDRSFSTVGTFLYYICGFAVPFFMMSSGFLILENETMTLKKSSIKIFNIFRIVTVWNVLDFAVENIKKEIWQASGMSLTDIPKNILKCLVQKGDTLSTYWYFGALILLYFIIPVLVRWWNKKNYVRYIIWAVMAIIGIYLYATSLKDKYPIESTVIQTFRLWTWIQYFMLGGFARQLHNRLCEYLTLKWHCIISVLITILVTIYRLKINAYMDNLMKAEYFYDSMFVIIWTFFLFTLFLRIKISENNKEKIRLMSSCTLGVYLVHPLVRDIFNLIYQCENTMDSLIRFTYVTFISFIIVCFIKKIPGSKFLLAL